MESYRLVFKESVAKDLRGLPKRDVARIERLVLIVKVGHRREVYR